MIRKLLVFLLLVTGTAFAQQPQTTTDPLFATNSRWANGVAPGYWPTPGAGLVLNIAAGTSFCGAAIQTFSGGSVTLTAASTNYVYLDSTSSCTPTFNTSGFTAASVPIAKVTTNGSAITSIVDDRTFFVLNNGAITCARLPVFTGGDVTSPGGSCVLTVASVGGTSATVIKSRGFGMTFGDPNGGALSAPDVAYFTIPYACTIAAWNITVDAGTATFDIWKIASGTAVPTVTNTITASALPAIASGTAIHSTTLTGWTTSVAANDIFGIQLKTVATAAYAELDLQCNQ